MDLYQIISIAGIIMLGILTIVAIVKSRNVTILDNKNLK